MPSCSPPGVGPEGLSPSRPPGHGALKAGSSSGCGGTLGLVREAAHRSHCVMGSGLPVPFSEKRGTGTWPLHALTCVLAGETRHHQDANILEKG